MIKVGEKGYSPASKNYPAEKKELGGKRKTSRNSDGKKKIQTVPNARIVTDAKRTAGKRTGGD